MALDSLSLLAGIVLGSLGIVLAQTVLTWVLGRLGLLKREEGALLALKAELRAEMDSKVLKLIEDANKSLASLQNQISNNTYYDASGNEGRQPASSSAKSPVAQRSDALRREVEGDAVSKEDYAMSRGAGGI